MLDINHLDAHEQPSDELRAKWKAFSKAEPKDLLNSRVIDDLQDSEIAAEFCLAGTIPVETLNRSFREICPSDAPEFQSTKDAPIYYHPLLPGILDSPFLMFTATPTNLPPGLLILPSLIPPEVQRVLLNHLIHRDLSDPIHQTNLHLHFDLPYPSPSITTTTSDPSETSFFSYPPTSTTPFTPKDPSVHKPLAIKQVLDRRLHWVTLGGQYDWTNRVYPDEGDAGRPTFPPDVAGVLETLFPETRAQAAIVNFYSPGDTMMMHRDVSEETDRGLISVSLGCDGLFMIAPNREGSVEVQEGLEEQEWREKKEFLMLRLRSGDAIYMTKDSRFAWHGVPKVLKGTCPDYLEDWPADGGKFEEWRGWMRNKRINLNVRQMRD